ncbi:MAG: fructose-6-phosphate aldolase [Roseovarius sp.]|nr:fructose-6-phosphate aldolase [Roseovarius sp.]
MKFFLDTADVDEIRQWNATGLLDGVTTNPSLILKSGRNIKEVLKEICDLVDGDVSGEVAATDYDTMVNEGRALAKIAENICIKFPTTLDGVRACKTLVDEGFKTNMTLCFSATQALLVAKAGATYVSPFIGRLDDTGTDGMGLIGEIRAIFDNFDFETQILAASIRTVNHVKDCALAGADVATLPPSTIEKLVKHPLTDKGLADFLADWEKTGQTIV